MAIATALSFGVFMVLACGDTPIGAPVGDQNYDDPNDPGRSGQNNVAPEAGDANGRACISARDCPVAFVCAYPVADACGATGRCLPYATDAGCSDLACACDGTTVSLCAPPGYATQPVVALGSCDGGGTDASSSDASAEASADAAAE